MPTVDGEKLRDSGNCTVQVRVSCPAHAGESGTSAGVRKAVIPKRMINRMLAEGVDLAPVLPFEGACSEYGQEAPMAIRSKTDPRRHWHRYADWRNWRRCSRCVNGALTRSAWSYGLCDDLTGRRHLRHARLAQRRIALMTLAVVNAHCTELFDVGRSVRAEVRRS